MNRRNILVLLAGALVFPCGLASASPKERPLKSSCEDCKKCGRFCKCECSKGCKCKPGCCKTEQSPAREPQRPRGFDGKTPSFRPPNSRPPSGFDRRTPGFGPPSHGRPTSNRAPFGHPRHILPKKSNHIDHEILMRRFDENKDGKIQGKEKEAAYLWFREVFNRLR